MGLRHLCRRNGPLLERLGNTIADLKRWEEGADAGKSARCQETGNMARCQHAEMESGKEQKPARFLRYQFETDGYFFSRNLHMLTQLTTSGCLADFDYMI
jgi:hypothetical protein